MSADEASFEEFFRSVRPSLTGQAWLMTGDLAEAHDLVQETLCRAWANWDRLQSYDQPAAWARKVLRNLVIGRWRRAKRQRRADFIAGRTDVVTEPVSGHLDVVAALNALPMKQRQAIVLRDFAGLSVAEIASELGAPEGTVKSWLSRGRAVVAEQLRLREVLDRGGN
jgi:RNA polymerase sigma-70 factor (ECF subfamily)